MKSALLFPLCAIAAAAQPQPSSPDPLLQALLSEVHQLRVAIERSNTIGPRIQLTVERIKIQQSAVNRIADQLELVRRDLESRQGAVSRTAEDIRSGETMLTQASDPVMQRQLEAQIRELKSTLQMHQTQIEALRTHEADLSGRLHSEQSTLDGLNDKLDQMERSLSQ